MDKNIELEAHRRNYILHIILLHSVKIILINEYDDDDWKY